MKLIFTILLGISALFASAHQHSESTIKQITKSFDNGNAQKLSEFFGSNVEIVTPTGEGVYSKAQARQVMQKFFNQHKVVSNKVIHNGTSNTGSKFIVLSYKTAKEEFRITVFLKQTDSDCHIQEIDIVKQI